MTEQEIKDLAREYVDEVYNGDMDFYDEAISVIGFVFRDHHIVSREKFENVFQELLDAYVNGDDDMILVYLKEMNDLFKERSEEC